MVLHLARRNGDDIGVGTLVGFLQNLRDAVLGFRRRRGIGVPGRIRAWHRGRGALPAASVPGAASVSSGERSTTRLSGSLRLHIHRLFGVGDQLLLHRLGRLGALGHRVIDLVVLVRHDGAARVFRLDLDRRVVGLDDHRRFAAALAAERQGKGAKATGDRHRADDRGDHQAAAARLCGLLLGQTGHRHRLVQFRIVVEFVDGEIVSLRNRLAAGQIVHVEAARGSGVGSGRRRGKHFGRPRRIGGAASSRLIARTEPGTVGFVVIGRAARRRRGAPPRRSSR